MRKFIKKVAQIVFSSILSIVAVYVIIFIFQFNVTGLAREVFYSIEKAGHNSGLPAVILGDSVCYQLWNQKEDSTNIAHLACNQAITPAGTYLLLKRYLEHNPQTQEVFYLIRPQTLGNDLDLNYTYQYFVIQFFEGEDIKLLDEDTIQKVYDRFGRFFAENGFIKSVMLNNNLFMEKYLEHIKHKPEQSYFHRPSKTTIIYLPKIQELCTKHNAKLFVLPLPIADTEENHDWDNFRKDVNTFGLDDVLGNFTEKIHYYPADWFRDGVHFKPGILAQHLQEIRDVVMH